MGRTGLRSAGTTTAEARPVQIGISNGELEKPSSYACKTVRDLFIITDRPHPQRGQARAHRGEKELRQHRVQQGRPILGGVRRQAGRYGNGQDLGIRRRRQAGGGVCSTSPPTARASSRCSPPKSSESCGDHRIETALEGRSRRGSRPMGTSRPSLGAATKGNAPVYSQSERARSPKAPTEMRTIGPFSEAPASRNSAMKSSSTA